MSSGTYSDLASQQAYFRMCLEDDIRDVIDPKITPAMPLFGNDSCIELLKEKFMEYYPVITRRNQFFTAEQGTDDAATYLERLAALSLEANIEELGDRNKLTFYKFMSSVQEERLREKIYDLKREEMPLLRDLVTKFVGQKRTEDALKTKVQVVAAVTATSQKRRRAFQPRNQQDMKGRCYRCGDQRHEDPGKECRVIIKNLSCNICNKWGHLANVCRDKMSNRSSVDSKSVRAVQEEEDYGQNKQEVTPRLPVEVVHDNGKFNTLAFPDTGSSTTMMSAALADKERIKIHPKATSCTYVSINGEPIATKGEAKIVVSAPSGTVETTALISTSSNDDFLLGYKDLRRLNVISKTFPLNKCTVDKNLATIKNKLINEYPDVLSDTLGQEAMLGGTMMKVHLKKDHGRPKKVLTARQIPLHWREKAEMAVTKLLESKRMVPEHGPTEWCAPAMFVMKDNGELRLVVDYADLNKAVERPVHVFPSSNEVVAGLDPSSKFFAKLDCTSGYHQVKLDEESSKLLTFLLPQGRFRPLVAPMGFCSSGDEFCRRSDEVIAGLVGVRKLVDDVLIQAPSIEVLVERIRALLERCKAHGMILSQRKFEIGQSVNCAGFVIDGKGVYPKPSKIQGIRDFPRPEDVSKLRGFLGMINQMNVFYPFLATMAVPLQGLLKKNVVFNWLPEHDKAFKAIKEKLSEKMALQHFDARLRTSLITDASRNGLGFALIQTPVVGPSRIIQCGSRSLTPAEQNYAVIELESLAIAWAINKCSFYLKGIQSFEVITDHRPLLGIFNKSLVQIENSRIVKIREKVIDYNFTITWLAGKTNLIADALSRAPVTPSSGNKHLPINACIMGPTESVQEMATMAQKCEVYQSIVTALKEGKKLMNLPPQHPARMLKDVWNQLSISEPGLIVLDASRIFVPKEARMSILRKLHESHCGIQKTWATARSMYYWPMMKTNIKQLR